jgi:4'-phosphopantetheinyl transferase
MIEIRWATPTVCDRAASVAALSADERRRMERLRCEEDRDRFAIAWWLARRTLHEIIGTTQLQFTRECRLCGNPAHGKPRLVDGGPSFSISHAGDRVILAVSDAGEVGVDVEVIRSIDELAGLVLHPSEAPVVDEALMRIWVRKESVIKASGHGLLMPMTTFALSDPPFGASVRDVAADDGYLAATAQLPAG